MKSLREWVEENNLNEIFGLFGKPKAKEPAPDVPADKSSSNKTGWACPFCKSRTIVMRTSGNSDFLQCNKCQKYWNVPADKYIANLTGKDDTTLEPRYAKDPDRSLYPNGIIEGVRAKSTGRLMETATNKTLYLAGLISEDSYYENEQAQQGQPANPQQAQYLDINQVASQLQFQPTSKKKLDYQYAASTDNMPAMSYTVAQQQMPVVTTTADGKETQNTAEPNDIIMSGPSREQYVIKSAKFPKLYQGQIGGPVHPEQGPRNVAVYGGNAPVTFTASWGESMVLKPGDYLVKEAEGKFYRIAKQEYEQTYNPPGKVG